MKTPDKSNEAKKNAQEKVDILAHLNSLNHKIIQELKIDGNAKKLKTNTTDNVKAQVLELMRVSEKLLLVKQNIEKQYFRALADSANAQKRSEEELNSNKKYQSLALSTRLIPIIDTFERALNVTNDNQEVKNFLIGFRMIYKLLLEALNKEGVIPIKTAVGDKFNHDLHHAIDVQDHKDLPPNHIVKIISKGYMLSDKVLRHSEVIVAKNNNKTKDKMTKNINENKHKKN